MKKYAEPGLKRKLLGTGDAELINGNSYGDRYWGICNGEGENILGKMMMQLRDEYIVSIERCNDK